MRTNFGPKSFLGKVAVERRHEQRSLVHHATCNRLNPPFNVVHGQKKREPTCFLWSMLSCVDGNGRIRAGTWWRVVPVIPLLARSLPFFAGPRLAILDDLWQYPLPCPTRFCVPLQHNTGEHRAWEAVNRMYGGPTHGRGPGQPSDGQYSQQPSSGTTTPVHQTSCFPASLHPST